MAYVCEKCIEQYRLEDTMTMIAHMVQCEVCNVIEERKPYDTMHCVWCPDVPRTFGDKQVLLDYLKERE